MYAAPDLNSERNTQARVARCELARLEQAFARVGHLTMGNRSWSSLSRWIGHRMEKQVSCEECQELRIPARNPLDGLESRVLARGRPVLNPAHCGGMPCLAATATELYSAVNDALRCSS